MTFIYGIATATVAIATAEIVLGYGLGDKLKDAFLWLKAKVLGILHIAKTEGQAVKDQVKYIKNIGKDM